MTSTYRIACTLLALGLAACGDDTASTSASGGSTGTTGGTTGGPTSGQPATDGPGETTGPGTATDGSATGEATTAAASSTDPTGATATTGDTTGDPGTTGEPGTTGGTTTDGTTGGVEMCGTPGEFIDAKLVHGNGPAPCGPLEFTGQLVSDPKGPAWVLDGCPCGANCLQPDPWSFTMVAPAEWLPTLPVCPRIAIDRQMGFGGCELVGVAVWDDQQPGAPALYHAGRGFQVIAPAQKDLKVSESEVKTCACDFCCGPSQLWDLAFDHLGSKATVAEGQTATLDKFTAINFQSHASGLCDAPLEVDWAVRQDP